MSFETLNNSLPEQEPVLSEWTDEMWLEYLKKLREKLVEDINKVREEGIPKSREELYAEGLTDREEAKERMAIYKDIYEKHLLSDPETLVDSLDDSLWEKYDSGSFRVAEEVPLEKVMPEIENGEYSYVIGVDASGRPSAILTWKAMNLIYDEKQFPHSKLIFIPGFPKNEIDNRQATKKEIDNMISELVTYFKRHCNFGGKRVLLVDDTLIHGDSISPICEALKRIGVSFDVVISSGIEEYNEVKIKNKLGGKKVVSGGPGESKIYSAKKAGRNYSGVIKQFGNASIPAKEQKSAKHFRKYSNLATLELLINSIKKWKGLQEK